MKAIPRRVVAPLLIVVVTLLAYGFLLSQLGFYRDDWYLFVTAQSEGTTGIVELFQIDRPLIGYFYAVAQPLLDFSPLAWHLAALALRLLGNLAFWRLVVVIWPERPLEDLVIALLFSIYPGYSVQPNAGVYSTDLAANAAALVSILLTIEAIGSSSKPVWAVFSVAAGALELMYLGFFESAIGLEVGRFALLWYALWRQHGGMLKSKFLMALRNDLPYIVVAGAFLFWRLLVFDSTRRATNLEVLVGKYTALPVRSILVVTVETLKDVFETTILAWSVPFYNFVSRGNLRDLAVAVALAIFAAAVVSLVLRGAASSASAPEGGTDDRVHRHLLVLGLVLVVGTLLPIDLAGRNVLFTDQWDRYTIHASAGVAMLVGGMLFASLRISAWKGLATLLVGMSVMVHYFSAAWYRDFWTAQRDLWQQFVWRAPAIKSGTMLLVELPVGGYQEGYEVYGPANMIYFPGRGLELGGEVINAKTAAQLQLQKNRQHYDRTALVEDNFRSALIGVYPKAGSCLHVLDGRKIELPGLVDDSLVSDVAIYSSIELIDTEASPVALPTFLGGHTPRPWCQYYQWMDRARQAGEWADVARLADQALSVNATPEDVSEWMPALEAYATLGRLQDARRAAAIIRSEDAARAYLCLQLQRGAVYPPPYDYNFVNQTLCQAN